MLKLQNQVSPRSRNFVANQRNNEINKNRQNLAFGLGISESYEVQPPSEGDIDESASEGRPSDDHNETISYLQRIATDTMTIINNQAVFNDKLMSLIRGQQALIMGQGGFAR